MTKETIEKMKKKVDELCSICAQDIAGELCAGCPCFNPETSDCYLVKTLKNMAENKMLGEENAD